MKKLLIKKSWKAFGRIFQDVVGKENKTDLFCNVHKFFWHIFLITASSLFFKNCCEIQTENIIYNNKDRYLCTCVLFYEETAAHRTTSFCRKVPKHLKICSLKPVFRFFIKKFLLWICGVLSHFAEIFPHKGDPVIVF